MSRKERATTSGRVPTGPGLPEIVLGGSLIAAAAVARRVLRTWGSTAAERRAVLPGDDLLNGSVVSTTTYAVSIDAEPARVWPWLAQLGQDRGGMYSYTRLENLLGLDIHNADTVHDEWQCLTVGDQVRVVPRGRLGMADGYAFQVAQVEPPNALVLRQRPPEHPWDATWAFVVRPAEAGPSRLVVRSRSVRPPGLAGLAARTVEPIMLPITWMMTRAMLLGIKDRAEGRADTGSTRDGSATA